MQDKPVDDENLSKELDDDKLDIKDEFDETADEEFLDDLVEETEDEKAAEDKPGEVETVEASESDELDKTKTIEEAEAEAESGSDVFKSDAEIDAVVDDIVRTESDESIAEADAKIAALEEKKSKTTFKHKIKNAFHAWWKNKPVRYGTFAGLFVLFTLVILLPTTRYTALNLFGVRVSSSMVIVDSQTGLPLKNIHVQLQDKYSQSGDEGEVVFTDLKLGRSKLEITKTGYADKSEEIVLGWGSNPIGKKEIVATGEQFTFVLSDWKSGEKIKDAEASAGESSAKADENGKIILTVGEESIDNLEVKVSAKGYREEKLSGDQLSSESIDVKLVPSKKHVFISNRNNKYDLYKVDVDSKNEEMLLEATKKEREVPYVLVHPTRDIVAVVSSRDGDENNDKFVLDGLFIIDSVNGETEKVARSEQLQIIGWSGDKIVYLQIVEGTSAGSPQRSKIISYDYNSGEKTELATANYFNDVELAGDVLYYAVSSYAVPQSQAKLYSVKVDGRDNKKQVDVQVWNIFRTDYKTILFNAENQKWFKVESGQEAQETAQVSSPQPRLFVDNPEGNITAWVDVRDGKGVLFRSDTKEFSEEQVLSLPGLNKVLYWVNNSTLVFRVVSNNETADYIINLDGGEVQKITDITESRNTYF